MRRRKSDVIVSRDDGHRPTSSKPRSAADKMLFNEGEAATKRKQPEKGLSTKNEKSAGAQIAQHHTSHGDQRPRIAIKDVHRKVKVCKSATRRSARSAMEEKKG